MILSTLATAIFFACFLAWLAPRIGLVDSPGGRKDHLGDIPLSGGIAIFLTVVVISTWYAFPIYTPQLVSVALIPFVVGVIDGIDGLSASLVAMPLLVLLMLAAAVSHPMALVLVLLLIPLGVFLCLNLGPNNKWAPKVFLGDGGSVALGFLLTASLVYFSQGEPAVIKPVTALWLVTVPLMDMLATMLRRVKHGLSPMAPDKSHLHHILMGMGLGPRA